MESNGIPEKLARNVLAIREHYGWSLATLAERAGVSINVVKHLSRAASSPGITTVLRLANATGVSLARLIGEEIDLATLPPESSIVPRYRDPDAMCAAIGRRARAYRLRDKWSRRKFVEHAKISKGTLHYLENHEVEPSVTTVERVAAAFRMSLAEFVEASESPILERVKLDDCRLAGRDGVFAPSAPPGSTEMLYVVEGTICVSFQSEQHLLRNGEAVLLMTDRPYTIASTTDEPAHFLRFARMKALSGVEQVPG